MPDHRDSLRCALRGDPALGRVSTSTKTYRGAIAEIAQYGGRWEVLKMRGFSAWLYIEAYCFPARSRARAQALIQP